MNPKNPVGLIARLGLLLVLSSSPPSFGQEPSESRVAIRVGWQLPTVTQGVLMQIMKRTDVLAQHGLEPAFFPFSYGTPEVQAAQDGELDAFFAGDQPTINLLATGGKWRIVAHVWTDRVSVLVPPNSSIQRISDLKGKIVASSFGSIAHREVIRDQQRAGLDVDEDVINQDVDILEIHRRIRRGGTGSWRDMDVAAVWEPAGTGLEMDGLARSLSNIQTLGVLAISDEFIEANPAAAAEFVVAIARSWDFLVRNFDRVAQWYIDDTNIGYSLEALVRAVRTDPKFAANSPHEVDLGFGEPLVHVLESNAAWGIDIWEDGREIRQFIDRKVLAEAMEIMAGTPQFDDLKVILPSIREVESREETVTIGRALLALVFVSVVIIALLSIETGFWLGKRRSKQRGNGTDPSIDTVVAAVLGMIAFVIALTFGSANTRFDARKAALLEDVTMIQTAYFRAALLPEPQRTMLRSLLRDYVQVRVGIANAYGKPDRLTVIRKRAETLQETMWARVGELSDGNNESQNQEFVASALNEMFELHTKRVVLGAYYRIPDFVWWVLLSASSVAMIAVGYQFGTSGKRRVQVANFSLALTFALVMLLAFDLDRAGEGMVTVNQQPMIDVYHGFSEID